MLLAPQAAFIPPPNRVVASDDGSRLTIRQATDAATILMTFEPAAYGTVEGTDPPLRRWNFAISSPADFSGNGTRRDRICGFGYNFSKNVGGTPTPHESDDDATFGWVIEDYYNIAATNVAAFEWYLSSFPAGTTADRQVRPIMAIVNYPDLARQQDPDVGLTIDVSDSAGCSIVIESRDSGTITAGVAALSAGHNIVTGDTVNAKWNGGINRRTGMTATVSGNNVTLSGGSGDTLPTGGTAITLYRDVSSSWHASTQNGLDCEITMAGKIGILWENNVQAMKQKLTSGTYKNLVWISTSNQMYLGEGGLAYLETGAVLRSWAGITTAYKTSSGTFTDGDLAGTAFDGAIGVTNFGGVRKIWIRAGGAWYGATCT